LAEANCNEKSSKQKEPALTAGSSILKKKQFSPLPQGVFSFFNPILLPPAATVGHKVDNNENYTNHDQRMYNRCGEMKRKKSEQPQYYKY
jgi:hypothetical protein